MLLENFGADLDEVTVHEVMSDIERRYYRLSPVYEFGLDDEAKSAIVEHLLLKCPAPLIYAVRKEEPTEETDNLRIVRGNAWIAAISAFLNNEFALTGLIAYPELNGKRFDELSGTLQWRLETSRLTFVNLSFEGDDAENDQNVFVRRLHKLLA